MKIRTARVRHWLTATLTIQRSSAHLYGQSPTKWAYFLGREELVKSSHQARSQFLFPRRPRRMPHIDQDVVWAGEKLGGNCAELKLMASISQFDSNTIVIQSIFRRVRVEHRRVYSEYTHLIDGLSWASTKNEARVYHHVTCVATIISLHQQNHTFLYNFIAFLALRHVFVK